MTKKFELPIKIEAIPFRIINNKVEFLIIKRIPEDGGFWQPVTGTLESDESLLECVYRELKEELGVNKHNINHITDMFFEFSWDKAGQKIYEYVYGVELKKDASVLLSEEHDDYKWCDFGTALGTLEKDNNKNAYLAFKNHPHLASGYRII